MPVRPIKIIGSDPVTGDLTLQDNNGNSATDFSVNQNDIVQWNVQPGSGVGDLTAFTPNTKESGSTDIFATGDPQRVGSSSNWRGTVIAVAGTFETYSIGWTDDANPPGSHTYDPKISVNP